VYDGDQTWTPEEAAQEDRHEATPCPLRHLCISLRRQGPAWTSGMARPRRTIIHKLIIFTGSIWHQG
jgi:hypothetical protein